MQTGRGARQREPREPRSAQEQLVLESVYEQIHSALSRAVAGKEQARQLNAAFFADPFRRLFFVPALAQWTGFRQEAIDRWWQQQRERLESRGRTQAGNARGQSSRRQRKNTSRGGGGTRSRSRSRSRGKRNASS